MQWHYGIVTPFCLNDTVKHSKLAGDYQLNMNQTQDATWFSIADNAGWEPLIQSL